MQYTRIISSNINNTLRVLLHERHKGNIANNEILSGFGVDASPYPGIKAIFAPTTSQGRGAIMGFVNRENKALDGERRMSSYLPDGSEEVTELYQLNDGSILIRAGIEGGTEKYSLLINPDGSVQEATPLKTIDGDMELNGTIDINGDVTIDAPVKIKLEAAAVEIGKGLGPAFEKLMNEVAMNLINTHTHVYSAGAVPGVNTSPPTQQMAADTHTTKDTKAS
jgi:hypothetical protein